MTRTIYRKLEDGFYREMLKLPYEQDLFKRTIHVNITLSKLIKDVGREYGLPDAETDSLIKLFYKCDHSFPNFDDELYISLMEGRELGNLEPVPYEVVVKEDVNGAKIHEICFDGCWKAHYNPARRELIGGHCEDDGGFSHDFRITDLDEVDVECAIGQCLNVSQDMKKFDLTFDELMQK